jgi:ABC-type branched-subunit amino acid transport system substrate-binding protein
MKLPKLPRIAYICIAAGICLFIAAKLGQPSPPTTTSTPICDAAQTLDRISCGSKILFPAPGGRDRRNKIEGFAAIKNKDFSKAKELLQKDFDQNSDPETLYALNNATIFLEHPQNVKTIAVPLPIHGAPQYVAENLIKGVSQAQFEWNQSNHDYKLLVAVADDMNEPSDAKQIAEELTKHQDVLAILGHYSSNVSVSVKDSYNQARVVFVSATSTTDELTSNKDDANNYFFRPTNTTTTSAIHLARYWANKPEKIVLYSTPGKKFSESFRKAFIANIPAGSIVKEFQLNNREDAAQELAIAKAAGAKTIVIIPDAYTDENERDRVFAVIRENKGQMPILGASIVRDAYLFKFSPLYLKNLVISIPVHPTDRQFINTAKLNQAPDWWGVKSQIHDRIINAYDSMQVLETALATANDRQSVRQAIASPGFSASGITGSITFSGSDRAKKIDSLVTPTTCDDKNCNFELAH